MGFGKKYIDGEKNSFMENLGFFCRMKGILFCGLKLILFAVIAVQIYRIEHGKRIKKSLKSVKTTKEPLNPKKFSKNYKDSKTTTGKGFKKFQFLKKFNMQVSVKNFSIKISYRKKLLSTSRF